MYIIFSKNGHSIVATMLCPPFGHSIPSRAMLCPHFDGHSIVDHGHSIVNGIV